MSIATEIQRLQQAKADIKTAIENKGVEVGNGTLDTYAEKISKISVGSGGGSAEGCVTVTFMNGNSVIFTRPVYIGDDCPDPLTQGRIETPTKESTVQYNYTYSGWTSANGGTADSSVLMNITENKVVYSAFTESVRTYTVTFYDTDGTTVLHTEQVAYGGSSTYTYAKENHLFNGWTPEPTNITGDLECVGAWEESYAFADASWEYIAQISESGKAAEVFAVGDTRTETIDGSDFTLEIIGFNHDTIADTGELAGITIWIKNFTKSLAYTSDHVAPWCDNLQKTHEAPIFDLLSSELQSVVKPVLKTYILEASGYVGSECAAKIWSLSAEEIDLTMGKANILEGKTYEKFANYPDKVFNDSYKTYPDITTGNRYLLRSFHWSQGPMYVSKTGYISSDIPSNYQHYIRPCFCV